ncbi:MAG: DUF1932 domain-containing protein [Acetobacterales bacterium]
MIAPADPATIALLGFGEAGTALARGLVTESGWRDAAPGRRLVSVDVAAGQGRRGTAMAERATQLGVELHRDYGDALAAADLVFSVVTGSAADAAADAARAAMKRGALYLDLNTITRSQTAEIAGRVESSGVSYVDVGVVGVFYAVGYRAPMLLAGPRAPEAEAWMTPLGFAARAMSERPGDASAVKMLRSILMKGIEALSVECLVAAREQDLLEEVLDCVGDVDRIPFRDFLTRIVTTHLVHVERRLEEVEKVNDNLRETGIEPLMSAATLRSHRRTLDAGVVPEDGVVPELDAALATLAEKVVKVARA